jgi:stringent starvation protein B
MSSRPRLPAKKDVALALLESSTVLIHLDPRIEEVRVPPWFKKQPQLVLEVGLNMPVPIPDLSVDDDAVSCTLSFSRSPFFCWIPWSAVYALVGSDGRSMVWPDDVPPEVVAQAEQAQEKDKQKKARRAHLRPVPDDGEEALDAEEAGEPLEPEEAGEAEQPAVADSGEASDDTETGDVAVAEAPTRGAPTQPEASPDPIEPDEGKPEGGNGKRKLPPYLRVVK